MRRWSEVVWISFHSLGCLLRAKEHPCHTLRRLSSEFLTVYMRFRKKWSRVGLGESLLVRFPLHKSIVARKKSLSRFLFMIIKEEQSAFFHSLDQPSPNIVPSRCVCWIATYIIPIHTTSGQTGWLEMMGFRISISLEVIRFRKAAFHYL